MAVIMAVYEGDRPEFLAEALDSIAAQTYTAVDAYVFKDGPIPESLDQVLRDFSARMPNLRVLGSDSRRCLAACLNDLIRHTWFNYSFFARMDADDVSEPSRVSKQLDFLLANPDVDVVGGWIHDMDERGTLLKPVSYPLTHGDIVAFFAKRNPMAHVTVMFRRSYFEKAGLYDPVPLEDGLYWMRGILAGCRFHNLSESLVRVRRSDDFLRRRSGLSKCWRELHVRVIINRRLKMGPAAYAYALGTFGVQMMPVPIKRVLYATLR